MRERTRVYIAAICVLLAFVLGPAVSFAGDNPKGFEGSWRVTVTGGSGTPELPSWYQALVTFDQNGGLIATITDPFL